MLDDDIRDSWIDQSCCHRNTIEISLVLFWTSCVSLVGCYRVNKSLAIASTNFKRCPGNSPACLGMVDYNCCGMVDHASDVKNFVIENSKRKKSFLCRVLRRLRFLCRNQLALIPQSVKKKLPKLQKNVFQQTLFKVQDGLSESIKVGQRIRNQCCQNQFPVDLFDKIYPPDVICNTLQRFVTEARERTDLLTLPRPCTSFFVGYLDTHVVCRKIHQIFLTGKMWGSRNCMELCDCVFQGLHENSWYS